MQEVQEEHKLTYQRNVMLVTQQMVSNFESAFSLYPNLSGKRAQILDLIGKVTVTMDSARGGDTPNTDVLTEPLWMTPHQFDAGHLFEKEDVIKALTDFQSPFTQAFGAAMARDPDSLLFSPALFGNRLIGEDGASTSSWAGQTVPNTVGSADGATDTGMNVKKILRGRRYMQSAHVDIDREQIYCGVNGQGMEELYNDIIYINKDYRDRAVIDSEKQVRYVAGTTIIPTEDLADIDGTHYGFALWCKSGMHWGVFSPLEINVGPNPNKKWRTQIYMEKWIGATRSEDTKVVKISSKK